MKAILANPKEMERRMKWRYRLEWREPKRLSVALSQLVDDISYKLFFKNTVPDKFIRDDRECIRREVERERQQRIIDFDRINPNPIPSTDLKRRAMENLAAVHQRDYESGEFKDPLGVAVQQTLGIGLAYNFDHMTPLKSGEEPTARRLQARMAKSAIRRVQELYDAQAAREELDSIADPRERALRAQEMQAQTEAEIDFLRKALTRLIPTDGSDPVPGIQIFRRRKFKKIAENEFLVVEGDYEDDDTVDDLTRKIRRNLDKHYDELRAREKPELSDDFLEAWKKQKRGNTTENNEIIV
jgi:hypothetical protein